MLRVHYLHCTPPAGTSHASQSSLDGVAWFVQISDTHLGAYDALPENFRRYGDKAGDLRYMKTLVLPPSALISLLRPLPPMQAVREDRACSHKAGSAAHHWRSHRCQDEAGQGKAAGGGVAGKQLAVLSVLTSDMQRALSNCISVLAGLPSCT